MNYVAVLPFGITAILSDLLIALGLCFLLRRSRTNSPKTDYLIKILVRYAITRCLLTSLIAVVEVILAPTFYSFAIDFVIGKRTSPLSSTGISHLVLVWSNSMLASLNSRRSLRDTSNRKNTGPMSASFRVRSPMLSTTGAETSQISVVQISGQGTSRSPDEESVDPAELRAQASRQSSELRFSGVDTQRTQ